MVTTARTGGWAVLAQPAREARRWQTGHSPEQKILVCLKRC